LKLLEGILDVEEFREDFMDPKEIEEEEKRLREKYY